MDRVQRYCNFSTTYLFQLFANAQFLILFSLSFILFQLNLNEQKCLLIVLVLLLVKRDMTCFDLLTYKSSLYLPVS